MSLLNHCKCPQTQACQNSPYLKFILSFTHTHTHTCTHTHTHTYTQAEKELMVLKYGYCWLCYHWLIKIITESTIFVYSVCVCVCVCLCVWVCVSLCVYVCIHACVSVVITTKYNRFLFLFMLDMTQNESTKEINSAWQLQGPQHAGASVPYLWKICTDPHDTVNLTSNEPLWLRSKNVSFAYTHHGKVRWPVKSS